MSKPDTQIIAPSLFEPNLSDQIALDNMANKKIGEALFAFFRDTPLFKWADANNDCEDRANAICILLDNWGITNCKGWVFNGYLAGKGWGMLVNDWGYHVAAMLPIMEGNELWFYVIDPATTSNLATLEDWASAATDIAPSYFAIKRGDFYIFPNGNLVKNQWHSRNRQNYKWTIQGLAGINGPTILGKSQLIFHKRRIAATQAAFEKLIRQKPAFLD